MSREPPILSTRRIILIVLLILSILLVYIIVTQYTPLLTQTPPQEQGGMLKVVTTFYPLYDFTKNIGGNRVDVNILVPETVDLHSFEPTPSTIAKVAEADMLIFSGVNLEPWVPKIVKAASNPKLTLVDSSQGINLLLVPSQFQQNNRTFDPHIWLNPVDVKQQVKNILNGLIKADPEDSDYFIDNANSYQIKLDSLNSKITNMTMYSKTRYFITLHGAFAYFAKQYNLMQIPILGPFEDEPTPTDIQKTIDAIQLYHLCYVGYETLENPAISKSIERQTNVTLILIDTIEGLSTADQKAGKDYLILMDENITRIGMALSNVGCN